MQNEAVLELQEVWFRGSGGSGQLLRGRLRIKYRGAGRFAMFRVLSFALGITDLYHIVEEVTLPLLVAAPKWPDHFAL